MRITQTAMLLGLSVAAQYYLTGLLGAGALFGQLVVGSLVNLFLVLAALTGGFFGGMTLAAVLPFVSFAIGRMPHFWMIPFVAAGNAAMALCFWLIFKKKPFASFSLNWATAALAGTFSKFLILYFGVVRIFVNFILPGDAALNATQIEATTAAISFSYSLPQLATALVGCILAYALYPALKKALPEDAGGGK